MLDAEFEHNFLWIRRAFFIILFICLITIGVSWLLFPPSLRITFENQAEKIDYISQNYGNMTTFLFILLFVLAILICINATYILIILLNWIRPKIFLLFDFIFHFLSRCPAIISGFNWVDGIIWKYIFFPVAHNIEPDMEDDPVSRYRLPPSAIDNEMLCRKMEKAYNNAGFFIIPWMFIIGLFEIIFFYLSKVFPILMPIVIITVSITTFFSIEVGQTFNFRENLWGIAANEAERRKEQYRIVRKTEQELGRSVPQDILALEKVVAEERSKAEQAIQYRKELEGDIARLKQVLDSYDLPDENKDNFVIILRDLLEKRDRQKTEEQKKEDRKRFIRDMVINTVISLTTGFITGWVFYQLGLLK